MPVFHHRERLSFTFGAALFLSSSLGMAVAGERTAAEPAAAEVTLLYEQNQQTLPATVENDELWIELSRATELTGFDFKPQGACRGELCLTLPAEANAPIVDKRDGQPWLCLTRFAGAVDQPFVAEPGQRVWCFGEIPSVSQAAFASANAPDFALSDRQGHNVRLSDFRGKKVLLLTWASWCQCSTDLPGWQALYDSLKNQNFEIVAAAQDSEGEAAAGKFYDRAKATFTTLIDSNHTVSSLYHMVNVPTGVWIDEQAKIVRPPEVAYTVKKFLGVDVGGDRYTAALRDWVARGADSSFALAGQQIEKRIAVRSRDERLADACFHLAVYFHAKDRSELAEKYWAEAQRLCPDNWNYHRQDWAFTPREALTNWMKKYRALDGRPYYAPLDLPAVAGEAADAQR